MRKYDCLNSTEWLNSSIKLVPIRDEDKYEIMRWRNQQIYHLRQSKILTKEDQDKYFQSEVANLFEQEKPPQLLFSFLENDICVGYGGLVHINWIDKHAEISFVMNTELEKDYFKPYWKKFLKLIEKVAFQDLKFHKIFTYAYDLRQNLFLVLEESNFIKEAQFQEHCVFNSTFLDVFIHSKVNKNLSNLSLRNAKIGDLEILYNWVNEKSVRENSLNSNPIDFLDHVSWFSRKIEDINCRIYILEKNKISLGQIRIDFINGYWEIDYSISKDQRGLGYGKKIIELLISKSKNKNLKAIVKKENNISSSIFISLGFKEIMKSDNCFNTYILQQSEQ